jgi:hypothetical protein
MENGKNQCKSAHTPTPWSVDGYGITSKVFNIAMLDTIAKDMDDNQIGIGELSANAAFIVKAVNSFEPMLEALKDIAKEIDLSKLSIRKDFSLINAHASALRAIYKAEGGAS